MTDAQIGVKHPPLAELLAQFLNAWAQFYASPVALDVSESMEETECAVNAFLLLNRWADNPVAEAIAAQFPEMAERRCAVPDEVFIDRLAQAPCLVPLTSAMAPHAAADLPKTCSARAVLAGWLAFASSQALTRLGRQDLCALVLSRQPASRIASHWVRLGNQQPPDGGDPVLFRYQDPRVMQRMWPSLTAGQRLRWLGPVEHWYALAHPWGPMPTMEQPQWFHAQRPAEPVPIDRQGSRFDSNQWHAMRAWAPANRIWRDYEDHGVAAGDQPDAQTMAQLLRDAAGLGLTGASAEDYVQCTWLHEKRDEGASRVLDWAQPANARLLKRIQAALAAEPQARFASLFHLFTRG